jgi:hypothetical protein
MSTDGAHIMKEKNFWNKLKKRKRKKEKKSVFKKTKTSKKFNIF